MLDTRNTLKNILKENNIRPYFADEDISAGRDILCKICENIILADFGVIELTAINNNVLLEFGMILGRNKPVFVLFDKSRSESSQIPGDIIAIERIEYKNQLVLKRKFEKGIKQYIMGIDMKKRELDSLHTLSVNAFQTSDFKSINSYLNLLYIRYNVYDGGNGKFFDVLKTLLTLLINKNNIKEYIRYSILIMRLYILQGKNDESLKCFDELFRIICNRIKYVKENIDTFIDPQIAKKLEGWEIWDYMSFDSFTNNSFHENLDEFFAYSWYNFEKSINKEKWINYIIILNENNWWSDRLDWMSEKELPLDDYDDYRFLSMGLLYTISILYTTDERIQKRVAREWENNVRRYFDKIVCSYLG